VLTNDEAKAWLQATFPERQGWVIEGHQKGSGAEIENLQLWSEFLEMRYQIARAWIMHALAQGRTLPSTNPEAWPE
jgi:hypothetical protein